MIHRDFLKLNVEPGDTLGIKFKDDSTIVIQFEEIVRVGKPYFLQGACHRDLFTKKLKLIQMATIEVLRKNKIT
jgi:hypothetical protein